MAGTMTWQSLGTSSRAPPRARCEAAAAPMAAAPRAAAAAPAGAAPPPPAPAPAPAAAATAARLARWRQHCCPWKLRRQARQPQRGAAPAAAAGGGSGAAGAGGVQGQETLADVMGNIFQQLMAMQQQPAGGGGGAHLHVSGLCYQPPGGLGPGLRACCLPFAVLAAAATPAA